MHRSRGIDELNTSGAAESSQQRQIQEKIERLLIGQLRDFQCNEVTDEALRRDMTNISRLPFTDEIEQAKPPHKFCMLLCVRYSPPLYKAR